MDSFTRECPAIEVDTSLGSRRVTRVLERIIEVRGKPETIRCDNGPEFTSRHFLVWCEENGVTVTDIQPGKPMQNGHIQGFNGRFRDECLNHNWFHTFWGCAGQTLDSPTGWVKRVDIDAAPQLSLVDNLEAGHFGKAYL